MDHKRQVSLKKQFTSPNRGGFSMKTSVLIFAGFLLPSACAIRKFAASGQLDQQSEVSFSANDLSVLFPPGALADPLFNNSDLVGRQIVANALGIEVTEDIKNKGEMPVTSSTSERHLKKLEDAGFWPNLVTTQTQKGFLNLEDWNDILVETPASNSNNTKKSADDSDEGPFLLEAAIQHKWYELLARDKTLKIDVRDPGRWKIVSMRFDPCPYGTKQKSFEQFNNLPQNCSPELRVVAQPVVGYTASESFMGSRLPDTARLDEKLQILRNFQVGKLLPADPVIPTDPPHKGWYFGDYAVHLFSRLTRQQATQFLEKLATLKKESKLACSTSGTKLNVNPCLLQQWMALGAKPIDSHLSQNDRQKLPIAWTNQKNLNEARSFGYATKVNEIWRSQWQTPYKAAFFASSNNTDPWIFSLYERNTSGNLRLGHIKPLETQTLHGKESQMMKNYKTGRVQIVPRGAGVKDAPDNNASFKPRLFPQTKKSADSLDIFVRTLTSFQIQWNYQANLKKPREMFAGLGNIEVTEDRSLDLLQMTSRIENPFTNDEFSTDCASCHLATQEGKNLTQAFETKIREDKGTAYEALLPHGKFWDPRVQKFQFRNLEGHFSAPSSRVQSLRKSNTDSFFAFNQFSIYRDTPVVSYRVANETELAVWLTNKFYGGKATADSCNPKALTSCLQNSLPDGLPPSWIFASEHERLCRVEVCTGL
jgi:hypothetical protein